MMLLHLLGQSRRDSTGWKVVDFITIRMLLSMVVGQILGLIVFLSSFNRCDYGSGLSLGRVRLLGLMGQIRRCPKMTFVVGH